MWKGAHSDHGARVDVAVVGQRPGGAGRKALTPSPESSSVAQLPAAPLLPPTSWLAQILCVHLPPGPWGPASFIPTRTRRAHGPPTPACLPARPCSSRGGGPCSLTRSQSMLRKKAWDLMSEKPVCGRQPSLSLGSWGGLNKGWSAPQGSPALNRRPHRPRGSCPRGHASSWGPG